MASKIEWEVARAIVAVTKSEDHIGCKQSALCEARAAIKAYLKAFGGKQPDTARLDFILKRRLQMLHTEPMKHRTDIENVVTVTISTRKTVDRLRAKRWAR